MHTAGHAADSAAADAALEAAAKRAARKRMAPRIRQLAGFLVALLFVLGIVLAWGYGQNLQQEHPKAGLYAELLFLGLVLWWGLVALSPWLSRLSRWIDDTVEVPPISNAQGLIWAVGILIGVPLAIEYWFWGTAIAISVAVTSAPALIQARRRWQRIPNAPLCFSCLAGTVAVLPLAVVLDLSRVEKEPPIANAPPALVSKAHARVLARDLRPLIFLDDEEVFAPVDVARAICSEGCDVGRVRDLADNIAANAALPLRRQRAKTRAGAIYHHVFRDDESVYIDYWWYFPHNPTPVARGLICGRALTRAWLGAGCAEHAADWEGITVMLQRGSGCSPTAEASTCFRRGGMTYEIRQVHYAQHEKVVVYEWTDLQDKWRSLNYEGRRPRVYVALNSHASYAMPCGHDDCEQLAHPMLNERRNGLHPWVPNRLLAIPTDQAGNPVRWAGDGKRFGKTHCVLFGAYCDGRPAPHGPAFQTRYKDPCPPAEGAKHCIAADGRF